MKKAVSLAIIVLLAGSLVMAGGKPARHKSGIVDTWIVGMVDRAPSALPHLAASLEGRYGAELLDVYDAALGGFLMKVPASSIEALAADPRVRFVEQDAVIEMEPSVSSTRSVEFGGQSLWHLARIDELYPSDMDGYYTYCSTGDGVVVYLIDTGVMAQHDEFSGLAIEHHNVLEYEYTGSSNPCGASGWHGTATASLIAGHNVGVAEDIELIDLRSFDCTGHSTISKVLGAFNWIIADGSSYWTATIGGRQCPNYRDWPINSHAPGVVNLSGYVYPGDTYDVVNPYDPSRSFHSISIEVSVRDVVGAGNVVVTSANNYSTNCAEYAPANLGYNGNGATGRDVAADGTISYPHIEPTVITVGGTALNNNDEDVRWAEDGGQSGQAGSGSNSGRCISIWAPANDIYSARNWGTDSYDVESGTSFAAPIVTGVVARYIEYYRDRHGGASPTPQQVFDWLDAMSVRYKADHVTPLVQGTETPDGYDTNGTVGMVYWSQPCRIRPAGF